MKCIVEDDEITCIHAGTKAIQVRHNVLGAIRTYNLCKNCKDLPCFNDPETLVDVITLNGVARPQPFV